MMILINENIEDDLEIFWIFIRNDLTIEIEQADWMQFGLVCQLIVPDFAKRAAMWININNILICRIEHKCHFNQTFLQKKNIEINTAFGSLKSRALDSTFCSAGLGNGTIWFVIESIEHLIAANVYRNGMFASNKARQQAFSAHTNSYQTKAKQNNMVVQIDF